MQSTKEAVVKKPLILINSLQLKKKNGWGICGGPHLLQHGLHKSLS
jgi:hypothetical protein